METTIAYWCHIGGWPGIPYVASGRIRHIMDTQKSRDERVRV